jgi:lipoprotein-releasing system ATP-binding protein
MTRGIRIELQQLSKSYRKAGHDIRVLREVDLVFEPGERVAVLGPSGAGKSTFLHLLGMLDRPSHGKVLFGGEDVATLPLAHRDRLRNRSVGFVFQAHHLLPEHTALANVMIPLRLAGAPVALARDRAAAMLRVVGLGERLAHQPGELSGGEQQRVALARALVMGPRLVLADEPTGNLDPQTAVGVFDLMMQLNRELGSTLVVVTHSRELADRFPRRIVLEAGKFREA